MNYNHNTKRHYSVKAYSPIKNHFAMMFTDLTKEISLEYELKESEIKYRKLFDNMSEGFAIHKIVLNKKNIPIDYTFININKERGWK